ncbi:hypothetical protein [Amycolatopsis panacis]|nr:hypothetical protein [Amycolatopsis panacis]
MPANDRYLLFTQAAVPDHPAWPEVAHPERRSHGPVLVAAVLSPSPGKYPRSVSDFVLGVDRRVRLVAARASLLTSVYRPFRRDRGRAEP